MESDQNGSNYSPSFTTSGTTQTLSAATAYAALLTDINTNTTATAGAVIGTVAYNDAHALLIINNGVVAGGIYTTNPTTYAIRGHLSSGKFFCLDNTGGSDQAESAPGSGNFVATCQ
jgi:hypothetical protein